MSAPDKVNLLGLTYPEMEAFFLDMGEKKFPRPAGDEVDPPPSGGFVRADDRRGQGPA